MSSFSFTVVITDGPTELACFGPLDAAVARAGAFARGGRAAIRRGAVIVDLSGVTVLDDAGLDVMLSLQRQANALSQPLAWAAPTPPVLELASACDVLECFDFYSCTASASRAIRHRDTILYLDDIAQPLASWPR